MKYKSVLNRKTILSVAVLSLNLLLAGCVQGSVSGEPVASPNNTPSAPQATVEPMSSASQPVIIESNGEVPFYARFGENETFDDGEWTVIVFYRPPSCIPADFNLNQFFHFPGENSPGAFACAPPTTTSVETWQNGPDKDPAPLISEMTGRGEVPVWLLANSEMESVSADGVVTISELDGLPSKMAGTAASYEELLKPTQSNTQPLIQFTAEGLLEDGRAFKVDVSKGALDVTDHVAIEISE